MPKEQAQSEVREAARVRGGVGLESARSGLEPAGPLAGRARFLFSLQQTAGNRAVTGLVQGRFGPVQREGVIQLLKVGDSGAGITMLATRYFNDSNTLYNAARSALTRMQKAGTEYSDAAEIVRVVEADPDVASARAEANVTKAANEAERKRKAESPTIYADGRYGTVTEYDIEKGLWRDLGRARDDHELVIKLENGNRYSFHVHSPPFKGQRPIAGEVMRNGNATRTQTPNDVIDCIGRYHSWPKSWTS